MHKRMLSLTLVLLLLSCLVLPAAAHDVPDFNRLGSISIAMTHDGKPVPGGSLTILRVADVVSDNGDMIFVYTADFSGCTIPVTELESAQLPKELEEIARDGKLSGITRQLDQQGKTKFSDLPLGLYLVMQSDAAPGFTKINPFLVSVPQYIDGRYVYDADTAPKNIPEPEREPTEPPRYDDQLPQTGQTNWPIPVMASVGMLMLLAGGYLFASGKKKNDET